MGNLKQCIQTLGHGDVVLLTDGAGNVLAELRRGERFGRVSIRAPESVRIRRVKEVEQQPAAGEARTA